MRIALRKGVDKDPIQHTQQQHSQHPQHRKHRRQYSSSSSSSSQQFSTTPSLLHSLPSLHDRPKLFQHTFSHRRSTTLNNLAMFLVPGNTRRPAVTSDDNDGESDHMRYAKSTKHPSFGGLIGSLPRQEALVTLFKRESSAISTSSANSSTDTVSMSKPGQRVIPATFNLVPIEPPKPPSASSSETSSPSKFAQAGGHSDTFQIQGSTLSKKTTDREAAFYEAAEEGAWPISLLPKFYGRHPDANDTIILENLTHGFGRPCVIDLKMGVQTVEDDKASLLKRLKMTALDHFTRSKSAGCRLEGLSMYRTLENRFVKGTKAQSHSLSAHVRVSLQDVLTFFLTDESGVRTDVALRFQMGVERILQQFQKNDKYRFIGSSILLIYDNDNRAPYMHWARALRKLHTIAPHVRLSEDQFSGLTRRTRCDVRMIDFAHTSALPAGTTRDEGYITGLQTILTALKAIRVYRSKPIFSLSNAVVDVMEEQRALKRAAVQSGEINFDDVGFTFDSVLGDLTALSGHQRKPSFAPVSEDAFSDNDDAEIDT